MLTTSKGEEHLVTLEVEGYLNHCRGCKVFNGVKESLNKIIDSLNSLSDQGKDAMDSNGIHTFANLLEDFLKSDSSVLAEFNVEIETTHSDSIGFQVYKLLVGSQQFLDSEKTSADVGKKLTELSSTFTEAEKSILAEMDFSETSKSLREVESFYDGLIGGLNAFLSKLNGDGLSTDDSHGSVIDPKGCTCSAEDVADNIERLRQDAKDMLSVINERHEASKSLCHGLKSIISLNEGQVP